MSLDGLLQEAESLLDDPTPPADPAIWLSDLGTRAGLAHVLDHTLLKPDATHEQILAIAAEGKRLGTATVCVNGRWVEVVAAELFGSATGVAAVIGFPLGAMHSGVKAVEARHAVEDGATELDMVLSLGDALAGDWTAVEDDIGMVIDAAGTVPVKVILESAAMPLGAVAMASLVAARAGARFVKTSTGFHAAGGASVEAVSIMRRAVGPTVGVKASGGVRTASQVLAMLAAGADRIGTSSSAAICADGNAALLIDRVRAVEGPVATEGGGYG